MDLQTATDAQVLAEFSHASSSAAFEELIRRFGRLVYNVVQRTLRDDADAVSASQAVFLTLARNPSVVNSSRPVADSLYQLAWRIACNARNARTAAQPEPSAGMSEWGRIAPLLDDELNELPPKLRAAIVVAHLQGQAQRESCHVLDCSATTLESCLTRAYELLKTRLRDRGVLTSEGMLAMQLSMRSRDANPPPNFVRDTAALAVLPAAQTPKQVATLSDAALRMVLWSKLKVAAVVMLMIALFGTGLGLAVHRACAETPATQPAQQR